MKNLRQMLHRAGWLNSQKRKTRPRPGSTRRLSSQALEKRDLLAGDIGIAHNGWNAFDVNDDRQVTALDAVIAINYLGQMDGEGEVASDNGMFVDVDGNGKLTALDPLQVINAISRGEEVGELVELLLTARDLDDNEITPGADGVINIDADEPFFLEVSYNDLRTFGGDIGAFQLFADISVSTGGILQPILNETQRLIFDGAVKTATSGSFTASLEGSATTYDSPLSAFGSNPSGEIMNALTAFGYSADQYELTMLDFGNDDIGFQIEYTDPSFGNVDLPDISVADNLDVAAPVTFVEFAPFEDDGITANSEAVRFNLNTMSRTFKSNEEFFGSLNRGAFDEVVGFTEIGGTGGVPTGGGGVPELSGDNTFIEPFDAFSIKVFLDEPVTDLVVGVKPSTDAEAVLLYGRNDPVPSDLVLLDDDASLTFSTSAVGVNTPPVPGPAVTATFDETDAAGRVVRLLGSATDVDGDTLSVVNLALRSGDASGITRRGNTLRVDPSQYTALDSGQSEVIIYDYDISDGTVNVAQTATITINGEDDVNRAPEVSQAVRRAFSENAANATVNLLQFASDPDGDNLNVANVQLTGDTSGVVLDGNGLDVTPSAYSNLNTGQRAVIRASYDVVDPDGLSVPQNATIIINGVTDVVANRPPTVDAPITVAFSEDVAARTIDLLTGADDLDGDTLTATIDSVTGDDRGITVNGNTLNIDPSQYNDLNTGQRTRIVYNYTISDGNGGSVGQTATITIRGNDEPTVNLPPVLSISPVRATLNEDAAVRTIDLLQGTSDPNGDTLNAINIARRSGDASGVTVDGNSLRIDPSAYSALNDDDRAVIVFGYDVSDGKGGEVAQTARIVINGVNGAPVVSDPIRRSFSEGGPDTSFSLLQFASDPDGDTLSVANQRVSSGDGGGVMVVGNRLEVFPSFYTAGDVVVVSYDVVDDLGASVAQTATVTIAPPIGVTGSSFVDEARTRRDGTRFRNGVRDGGELGLAGVTVHLRSTAANNSTGAPISLTTITDIHGDYAFPGVPAGTFQLEYDLPENVIFVGSSSMELVIEQNGSEPPAMAFAVLGLGGSLSNLDILGSSLLRSNPEMADLSSAGVQGGSVALDEDGNQELFIANDGFEDLLFAELTLNEARDAALLTIIEEDGSQKTAQLSKDHFVVSADGRAVQFFGGVEDFIFVDSLADLLTNDFAGEFEATNEFLDTLN